MNNNTAIEHLNDMILRRVAKRKEQLEMKAAMVDLHAKNMKRGKIKIANEYADQSSYFDGLADLSRRDIEAMQLAIEALKKG